MAMIFQNIPTTAASEILTCMNMNEVTTLTESYIS